MPKGSPYTPEVVALLSEFHEICNSDDSSYEVHHSEADDTWCIRVNNNYTTSFMTKNYGFLESALKVAIALMKDPKRNVG